jgi:2-iminobutanoate/2-iminopropanoate deaminase
MKKLVYSLNAPKPLGPYSQAVLAGHFLFVSGQLAIDPKQDKIVVLDITIQTRQVMENLKAILEAAGYGFKDVVQSTVYLTDMAMFEEFNCEYAKYFEVDFPARVTAAVGLKAGALVEVSLIAYKE